MTLRAFPVLYARDVDALAAFYARLGFRPGFRLPQPDGSTGYVALARDGAEMAITVQDAPRLLAGIEPGPGPRHEMFVYVEDIDATVASLCEAGARLLREPADMPWGERVGYLTDPEGNVISLGQTA